MVFLSRDYIPAWSWRLIGFIVVVFVVVVDLMAVVLVVVDLMAVVDFVVAFIVVAFDVVLIIDIVGKVFDNFTQTIKIEKINEVMRIIFE